jgi:hypothetical protein
MAIYPCPICGDPNAYTLWRDDEPPKYCPEAATEDDIRRGPEAVDAACARVKCITDCSYQMQKAAQRARWRKLAPECFDENGNIKPGMLTTVLLKAQPADEPLII